MFKLSSFKVQLGHSSSLTRFRIYLGSISTPIQISKIFNLLTYKITTIKEFDQLNY